jgi:hypothetical protein
MSAIKKGTLCMIIGGCPENIGMIVEVVAHLGCYGQRNDAYEIKTVTGKKFNQLWDGNKLVDGYSETAITDRYKLRPISDNDLDKNRMELMGDLQLIDD